LLDLVWPLLSFKFLNMHFAHTIPRAWVAFLFYFYMACFCASFWISNITYHSGLLRSLPKHITFLHLSIFFSVFFTHSIYLYPVKS
jgi:hypothetical protein